MPGDAPEQVQGKLRCRGVGAGERGGDRPIACVQNKPRKDCRTGPAQEVRDRPRTGSAGQALTLPGISKGIDFIEFY